MESRHRYFIKLAYNGKAYHGWQWQSNALTVQQVMEAGASTIFGSKISLTGAGRTDTGVHAREFYAHFDLDLNYNPEELEQKVHQLNGFLPKDICVLGIIPVAPDAHARFDALSRTYEYHITTRKDPFNLEYAWLVQAKLDLDMMNRGAAIIMEYRDFTSFSKLHTQVKTNHCEVMEAGWEQHGHLLVFTIRANRFLRNMVRAIVGTLVDLGRGKMSLEELRAIIEARNRSEAGRSVPAHGLFLARIDYGEEVGDLKSEL
jgi:tRNA pseudouridine38-40 synthase